MPRTRTKRAILKTCSPEDRLGEDCLTPTGNSAINSKTQNFLKTNAAATGKCLETWSLLHNYDSNLDLFLYVLMFQVVIDCAVLVSVTIHHVELLQVHQPNPHFKPPIGNRAPRLASWPVLPVLFEINVD